VATRFFKIILTTQELPGARRTSLGSVLSGHFPLLSIGAVPTDFGHLSVSHARGFLDAISLPSSLLRIASLFPADTDPCAPSNSTSGARDTSFWCAVSGSVAQPAKALKQHAIISLSAADV
jgi:hypothetical protein